MKFLTTILALFLTFNCFPQLQQSFALSPILGFYLDPQSEENETIENEVRELAIRSHQKLSDDPEKFVHWVYSHIQRKYLKRYVDYTGLAETMTSGKYNCLSGTALMGLVFESIPLTYEILEFDYHIVLRVKLTEDRVVLIESTDPFDGIITDPKEIQSRMLAYQFPEEEMPREGSELRLVQGTFNVINLKQLAGLQYFNLAVNQFNQGDYQKAVTMTSVAADLYPGSERIQNFIEVLAELKVPDLAYLKD